ncbi:MAG: MBL fold metallo-hydrolase [Candidatus Gastranaerophilales bacterium]|nr:MBL fold metallo-hydrolase [Candidatus Gastranaerophilales bacterium]
MLEKSQEFNIKFHGIRGSYSVSSQNVLKYGGNTSCVEVRVNGHVIIIDAGSGIINLGSELVKDYIASGTRESSRIPINATILLSHTHYDHISGIPFFKPTFIDTSKINMFGPDTDNNYFEDIITNFISTPYFPINFDEIVAQVNLYSFKPAETIVLYSESTDLETKQLNYKEINELPEDAVVISCIKSQAHPKDGVLIFKISYKQHSIVYASDVEGYLGGDIKLINFARNADILIHDSQYLYEDYASSITPKQGFGHSTPEMAAEIAKLANVKKLVIYHIDPSYNDEVVEIMENNVKKYFGNTIAAREGLEISLL